MHIRAYKVLTPVREYPFAQEVIPGGKGVRARFKKSELKNWLFDFAWPDLKFAVEVEGGAGFGRHTTREGFKGDLEKYHHAMDLGWTVYRCDGDLIRAGKAIEFIKKSIGGTGG